MNPRAKAPTRRSGAAARLARDALDWSTAGLEGRAQGRCGAPMGAEVRHRSRGHDIGCAAIGMPRHELVRMIGRADVAGAAGLITDALDEAIGELARRGSAWSIFDAHEVIGEALERRITPAPALARSGNAIGARTRESTNSEEPRPSRVMTAAPRARHG